MIMNADQMLADQRPDHVVKAIQVVSAPNIRS